MEGRREGVRKKDEEREREREGEGATVSTMGGCDGVGEGCNDRIGLGRTMGY
jgi:hypothetical protein